MACSNYSGCTTAGIYLYIASYRYMFLLRSYKKIVFCGFDSWKTEAFFLHLENKEIKITAVSLEKLSWKTLSGQLCRPCKFWGVGIKRKKTRIKNIIQRSNTDSGKHERP